MSFLQKANNLYQRIIAKNYFLTAFILLWVYFICLYPSLFQEVFAEHGSNYLFYAYNKNFVQNIWKDDAGYLVWLPRVIALLVSTITSPYWFILITNLIAQGFIAFFVSFFNHRGFRDILPDHQRFFISLLLGIIILPIHEIFTYVNFSYMGFFFISFLLFLNKENLRGGGEYLFYCILCALLCISKFHFVLFLPLFLVFMAWHWHRKEKKSICFYIPAMITILIQLVHVVLVTTKTGVLSYTIYNNTGIFRSIILAARGLFLWAAVYATNFRFLGHAAFAQLAGLSFFTLLMYFGIKSYKNHTISAKILCLFIVFNLIAIMFGCITSLSHWTGIANIALKNEPFRFGRRWFISYDMIYLAVVILLCNLINAQTESKNIDAKRDSKIYTAVLTIFLTLSVITTGPKIFDKDLYIAKGNKLSLSDWAKLHVLLNNDRYYIPVDPFPFGLYAGIKKGTDVGKISDNIYAPKHQFANTIDGWPYYDCQSFTPEGDLLTENLLQNKQKVIAVIAAYPKNESIYALALDAQNQVLARSHLLSSSHTIYKYLLFDQSVSAAKIRFLNQDDEPIGTEITLAAVYIEHQQEN